MRREPDGDLVRQAYLFTGDPGRAAELADRAARVVEAYGWRLTAAEALERAKAELARSYVADPGPPPPVGIGGRTPHPDVAMWRAICRLPARRRTAIVLRYDEGLSEEQTAARMNTTPRLLRADVDAAMLTLRTAVPGVADPWTRVAEALAAAGRGWSDYTRPAANRVAEVLSAPAPAAAAAPAPRRAHGATAAPGSRTARSARPAAVVATAVAALLLAAGVVVPRLGGDDPTPSQPGPTAAAPAQEPAAGGAAPPAVPAVDVPEGLLNWPPRGQLAADQALVAAAAQAWKRGVPAAEAPTDGVHLLWAGNLDGRTVAVVQGLDRTGQPRLAQVAGATDTAVRLQHAELLHGGTQVLTLLPPAPSGPVRVLVSPEAQVADGLLASDPMDGKPLRHMVLGPDGVSGILPSPPGVPTCSRVVLLGLDQDTQQATGAKIIYSATMTADMLAGMPMEVEVGSATLAPAHDASPETRWFTDGAKLAPKVPGRGTLTVAALGPRLADRPLDAADKRTVSTRAYELRRGNGRWIGSVVDVDGKTVCASVLPAGSPAGPAVWVLRCPIPGTMMPGIVHVVGAPGTQSVDVSLQPTRSPAGQEAFAALQVAPMGFPCGVGTLRVHSGRAVTETSLAVYKP